MEEASVVISVEVLEEAEGADPSESYEFMDDDEDKLGMADSGGDWGWMSGASNARTFVVDSSCSGAEIWPRSNVPSGFLVLTARAGISDGREISGRLVRLVR